MFTGLIEEIGTVESVKKGAYSAILKIRAKKVLEGLKAGDSIAVNGICLTVARISGHSFSVSVIPHTARMTILGERQVGDKVNLETDIIGKYVEKLLRPAEEMRQGGITEEFLAKYGF